MELNREQIIKALECCKFGKDEAKCKECNWHPWIKPRCWRLLASNALSLIKELTEENERLRERVKAVEEGAVRSFESQQDLYRKMVEALNREIHEAKADTVRKMQERLYREFASLGANDKFNKALFLTKVDQIAKEMLEGK